MTCTSFEHDANVDLETGVLGCPTSLDTERGSWDSPDVQEITLSGSPAW
ncbi:hypothetical protein ANMWB30_00940 [Arthrobacter sp. MWB30]|nr:hypothetical protein ANMWB30_00940 [Arthrobacter sp. MWB30]